jgi:hypothetical protein
VEEEREAREADEHKAKAAAAAQNTQVQYHVAHMYCVNVVHYFRILNRSYRPSIRLHLSPFSESVFLGVHSGPTDQAFEHVGPKYLVPLPNVVKMILYARC